VAGFPPPPAAPLPSSTPAWAHTGSPSVQFCHALSKLHYDCPEGQAGEAFEKLTHPGKLIAAPTSLRAAST
jgi:hypothetical protein